MRNRISQATPALGALMMVAALSATGASPLAAQGSEQEQKVAALKQAAAANQAALRQYVWVQHTSIAYKGEEKSTKDEQVRYDAAGKLQKTPIAATAPEKKKGIRGKVAGNKGEELKEYMGSVVKLVEEYVPPVPADIQAAFKAGKVMMGKDAAGLTRMEFRNYKAPGDLMTLTFDLAANQIRRVEVSSALEKDPVTLTVVFQNLPDGTNYAALTTVNAVAKELVVTIASRNHVKAAQ
jgi:hypothetical protein